MRKSTRKTILGCVLSGFLLAAPLAGCARPIVIEASLGAWCATNKATTPTRAEYAFYTREQKVDMADHNDFGVAHCGWKP